MSSYFQVIRHGFDFNGLCDRLQFWSFIAVHCLISLLLLIIELRTPHQGWWPDLVYSLFICVPFIAAVVRRLRDTGWSLNWLFAVLVPLGVIFLLWLLTLPSQDGIAVEAEHHA